MYIRNAIENRLSETLELYEMERANPKFPMLTHEYFYGKCMGILEVALSLGMDEEEVSELYEPYRLRLLSLKGEEADCLPEEYDLFDLDISCPENLEDIGMKSEVWFNGESWSGMLYGEDIETHYLADKTKEEVLNRIENIVKAILKEWSEMSYSYEEYTMEDELADREFEAARERRYGYDD